ncbi:hypothetical protein [Vibrio sp. CAU 1672]|uniref:hypothetical protein n=1 Tax=Vibrio sp. CAU 1672 TaxID=3032594 RepID=UPI0023DB0C63|nr:hypothetical protein [Vibrio sp. CAU 1672]MDF2155425.1 hypothetical protein [Vibrio sp. CAU 1672]
MKITTIAAIVGVTISAPSFAFDVTEATNNQNISQIERIKTQLNIQHERIDAL